MGTPNTVVILGGGVGGLVAARRLRERLSREHCVVLVDREREHLFAPSLLWLMVGLRDAASIKRPLKRLERKGIEVRLGEIEKIDPEARQVETLAAECLIRFGARDRLDGPAAMVLPDSWDRYRAKAWMREWAS